MTEAAAIRRSVSITHRPVRPSSLVAVVAAAGAVVLLESATLLGFVVGIAGLAVASLGADAARDRSRVLGAVGLAAGGSVALAGLGLAVASVSGVPNLVEVGLGAAGVALVGLGVLPVRAGGSRLFVKAGTALLVLCVVAAGLFQTAEGLSLLLACTATVLAWDAGENAINVGEQLGREATTWTVEAAHLGGTTLVGAVAVGAGLVVGDLGSPGLPLSSLSLLLVSLVFLTLALHD